RVPAGSRRLLLLHRAERAAPGRAPGHGARARGRHRPRAAPDRCGRAAGADRSRRAARSCARGPRECGGSGPWLRPGPGAHHAVPRALGAGGPVRHLRRGRHRRGAAIRLVARQADRVGRVAARGDRTGPPRSRRAPARRNPDDARTRDRRPAQRGFCNRPLLDRVPRRRRRRAPGPRRLMAGRRAARRTALVLLYQWDVTGQELASLYEGEIDEFSRELAEAVVERHEELDRRITEASDEWTADRLGALERNILRPALLELGRGELPPEGGVAERCT